MTAPRRSLPELLSEADAAASVNPLSTTPLIFRLRIT